jgi:NADH:ubiquinone oxidoreductase subunit F (NADH-binding)
MTAITTPNRLRVSPGPASAGHAVPGRHVTGSAVPRLLPRGGGELNLVQHDQLHGPIPYRRAPGLLISDVEAAGLTGRGGAAFPTATKMAAVLASRRRPVVVANVAESEPASGKDKQLIRSSPHLVLDGLQLAAEAVGAGRAFVYAHGDGALPGQLRQAIAERSAAQRDRVPVELVEAPPSFVAGQETALINKLNDGPALPRFTPPMAYERGVAGAPTLVQNAETLAHVALIARYGPAWFRAAGTPGEPGTMLVTCHHADGTVTVTEAEIGVPLRHVLRPGAEPVQAVLVGGYHGAWIRGDGGALALANASLRPAGVALGAGVLAALPAGRCGLAEVARVTQYLAGESARQCGPCLTGLPLIAGALSGLAGPRPDGRLVDQVRRWSGLAEGRGACRHPDGTVRFVRSGMAAFSGEIARHLRGECVADSPDGSRRPFLPVPDGSSAARERR